jgi:hypothetical protein
MGFPQLSNIAKNFTDTINSRAGNNVKASQMMPWIRVTSTLGNYLSLESVTGTQTFAQKYGNTERSGRVGINKNGESVVAEPDRGFRPSPTINSVSVSQGNEGLSKKISFTIVAYSLGQAEVLMQYFMEPGNMVLVEWGENNSNSISQKTSLDKCSIVAYNNLKHIQKKRAQSGGTYDAVLGTITGGDVKFGSNETYEINVELTSIGELPAYLQHHKNVTSNVRTTTDSGKTFKKLEIKRASKDDVGKSLFMQMFNDLPQEKRTTAVKNLVKQKWATDQINFINIDKEIREDIVRGVENARVSIGGDELKVPSDTPIFSEKRFIRCALAFEILDMQSNINISPIKKDCGETNTSSAKISWKNTVCRAHPHMFSANSDFLYIPNKQAPSFDLAGALKAETAFENPIPSFESLIDGEYQVDIHPPGESKYSYFPNNNDLRFNDQGGYDNQFLTINADKGRWGYLRDLYINFDFFCECIQSSGLVTKELWYKILNGLSSAVNLYWDFQIIPRGAIKKFNEGSNVDDLYYQYIYGIEAPNPGDEELQIVDVSFIGNRPNGVGRAKFQSRGTQTPFLESSFNLDIPGGMKGQVIGNKLSGKKEGEESKTAATNPNAEQKEVSFDGLFSNERDEVLEELNSIQQQLDAAADDKTDKEKQKEQEEIDKEQKIANFEMFVKTACIVPNVQDRSKDRDFATNFWDWYQANNVNLDTIMVIGAWDDTNLLKTIQRFDDGYIQTDAQANQERTKDNLPLLPIKFDFTVHGVSGIRVGDTFNIKDLPLQYKDFIFQVTQVEHEIAQNIWTTKVNGQLRMMRASEEDPIEYK